VSDAVRHPVFALLYAWLAPFEDRAGVAEHRRALVIGLHGQVLELGVGKGLSFRHQPPEVERLVAVEPEPTMRAHAAKAAQELALDVELVDATATRCRWRTRRSTPSSSPRSCAPCPTRRGRWPSWAASCSRAASCASSNTRCRPRGPKGACNARSTRRCGRT
jgi:hypothetical protein